MKCMIAKGFGTFDHNGKIFVAGDVIDVTEAIAKKHDYILIPLPKGEAKTAQLSKGMDKTQKPGYRQLQKGIIKGMEGIEKAEREAPITGQETPPEKPPEEPEKPKGKGKGK